MIKRTVFLLTLAALAIPGTAAAQKLDVQGPLLVKGHGPLRAELTMANASETRAVVFGGQRGIVRFVDLSGDLRVQCQGRGRARRTENEQGQTVFTCAGRGGRARAHGSHFAIRALLKTYGMLLPEGASATLQGRFKTCKPGTDECRAADQQGDRADRAKERAKDAAERAKERAEKAKERAKERQNERPKPPEEAPADDEQADEDVPSVEEVEEIVDAELGDG